MSIDDRGALIVLTGIGVCAVGYGIFFSMLTELGFWHMASLGLASGLLGIEHGNRDAA